MNYIPLASAAISFLLTIYFLPKWISTCQKSGLLWEDMNKYKHPRNVASSGGIVVIMAFILGSLSYIALKTFIIGGNTHATEIFALLSVILILGIIGLTDDLLGWKNNGLPKRIRALLALMASIPLVVINAGNPYTTLPFVGAVNLGIFFALIVIPLGIAGASGTFNFLAGYNGLEAGQGILLLSFLSFVAYHTGSPWLSVIGFCMVASLLAFYLFNKFPAKVFPGDIMTYSIGALIAGMAILGNFERIAIIAFIPYILEFFLKIRGKLSKHSFGIPKKDGTLKMPYKKVYGLEHLAILILNKMGGATEKKVTYIIFVFQIIVILIATAILLS